MIAASAWAQAPALYHSAGYQSPVRAAAGELLLLPGANLSADARVTLRGADPTQTFEAAVERAGSQANALVVRVPAGIDARTPFTIEVQNPDGRSARTTINDTRPLWFVPRELPTEGAPAGAPRELRIVGRNLAPLRGGAVQVVLRGPREMRLRAILGEESALDEFVVRVAIPSLAAGEYRVALSRDGEVPVTLDSPLRIVPARDAPAIDVSDPRFGGCTPDDARDDSGCVLAALAAAQAVRGRVRFSPGRWRIDAVGDRPPGEEGLLVPRGVDLVGDAAGTTEIVRGPAWQDARRAALFTLEGENGVRNIAFVDGAPARAADDGAFLQLGRSWNAGVARAVAGIVITGCRFSGASVSVRDGGLPIRGLVITHNLFRARRLALALGGSAFNTRDTFRIEDSIVRGNRFEPGGYLDVSSAQGARAAEFGAAERLDFSANVADGTAHAGLDLPGDVPGWRAAFFWHLLGPQEQVLISGNSVSCSGDKAGDGEAIALDNNHNTFALRGLTTVNDARRDSITIAGTPLSNQRAQSIDPVHFYVGHWVQIAAGTGVGQSRRIVSVDVDAANARTVLRVAPDWDVIPTGRDSRAAVGREFWQVIVAGNHIDHRKPPCLKSNRTGPRGGAISIWGQSSDSVVARNVQLDTNGIAFQQSFDRNGMMLQYFLDIRANRIEGEYDATRAGTRGIVGSHGAAPDLVPPVAGFGISIAGNTLIAAPGARRPAISLPATWYRGPAPHAWALIDRPLIFGNDIRGGDVGVEIAPVALVRHAIVFVNRCQDVARALRGGGPQLRALCEDGSSASCGCGR